MPCLEWPDKRASEALASLPFRGALRTTEAYGASDEQPNRLIAADNLLAMQALLPTHRGQIDLVYIDPPFGMDDDFAYATDTGLGEQLPGGQRFVAAATAYHDSWAQGTDGYLSMMLPRLILMHQLLKDTGSLYVHVDPTMSHYIKALLDEVFGPRCFQREIIWRIGWISGYKSAVRNWARNHDVILFYVKTPGQFTFHKEYVPHLPGYQRRGGGEGKGYPIEDVWNASPGEQVLTGEESLDSIQIKSFSAEKTGFGTQKNKSLLRRIIRASSSPGDLVADFFCGSGTTLLVAEEESRRWIGCDSSPIALTVARKRLAFAAGPGFRVEVVTGAVTPRMQGPGWDDAARQAVLLAYGGGDAVPAPLLGQRNGRGVLVAGFALPVTGADVAGAAVACRAAGLSGLDVLGWRWDLDVSLEARAQRACGTDVALLQVPALALDHGARSVVFPELPEVDFCWDPQVGRLALQGLSYPHPERLAAPMRTRLDGSWAGFIDWWAVAWEASEVFAPDVTVGQTRKRGEEITLVAVRPRGGDGSGELRVTDIFGQQVRHRLTGTGGDPRPVL